MFRDTDALFCTKGYYSLSFISSYLEYHKHDKGVVELIIFLHVSECFVLALTEPNCLHYD